MDVKMQDKRKPGKFTAWKRVIIGEGDWLDADGSLLKPAIRASRACTWCSIKLV